MSLETEPFAFYPELLLFTRSFCFLPECILFTRTFSTLRLESAIRPVRAKAYLLCCLLFMLLPLLLYLHLKK